MKLFYLIILITNSYCIFSQSNSLEKINYVWFDNIVGLTNTNLQNGIQFRETYKTLKGNNQYFISEEFKSGYIVYDGQPYYDVLMKYDVFTDNVIIRLTDKNSYFAIKLVKELINSFEIDRHIFLNSNTLNLNNDFVKSAEFYEVLFKEKDIALLKKRKKEKKNRINNDHAYVEFKNKTNYFVFIDEKMYKLISKKSILNLFPAHKKNINAYYDKNKTLMKYDYDSFLSKLISSVSSYVNSSR